MNKLFKRLTGVALGLALTLGAGITAARFGHDAVKVDAVATDNSLFELVTSNSALEAGASYLITNSDGSKSLKVEKANNNIPAVNTTKDGNNIKRTNGVMSLTLGGSDGAWTFKIENGASKDYYLTATNSTSKNYLKTVQTVDNYAKFGISISNNGDATIKSTGKNTRNLLQYNSSSKIFACYSSGQLAISLYKEVKTDDTLNNIVISDTQKSTTAISDKGLEVGKELKVYATAIYSTAGATDVTTSANWTSSNEEFATVEAGVITGVSSGETTIKAEFEGKEYSFNVTVTNGPTVELSKKTLNLLENDEDQTIEVTTKLFETTPTLSVTSSSDAVEAEIVEEGGKKYLSILTGTVTEETKATLTVSANGDGRTEIATLVVTVKPMTISIGIEKINLLPTAGKTTFSLTATNFEQGYEVSVSSSKTSVFTTSYSEGEIYVTPVAEGEGTLTITVSNGTTRSKTITIPVSIKTSVVYEKITALDQLSENSQILIVNEESSNALSGQNGNYRNGAKVSIIDYQISSIDDSVEVITLTKTGDKTYSLKASDGYLTLASASNYLTTSANAYDWNITFEEGNANIIPSTYTDRRIEWNNSNPRFACYKYSQKPVQIYSVATPSAAIVESKLETTNGVISAAYGDSNWTIYGFEYFVRYEGDPADSWTNVTQLTTFSVEENVPATEADVGTLDVTLSATFNGKTKTTSFKATVTDGTTPISEFYSALDTTKTYKYKGTVIAIEGNSYYLQQKNHGILIYGGSITPPEGMKVGDLVQLTSKVQNYKTYVIENNGGADTAEILGNGTLPTPTVVNTTEEFKNVNQSTRLTYKNLSEITWTSNYGNNSSGVGTAKDANGGTVSLYISKYIPSELGNAILAKLSNLPEGATIDYTGAKCINSNNGEAQLTFTNPDEITINTTTKTDKELVQEFVDNFMHMTDVSTDNETDTGACRGPEGYYAKAKDAFNKLTKAQRELFVTDATFANAYLRLTKWATANEDTFDAEYQLIKAQNSGLFSMTIVNDNKSYILILVAALVVAGALTAYLVINKKRKNNK